LAVSGEMAFALQNGFSGFVNAAALVAEESLPGLKVELQILLTASISVARCERSFSKNNNNNSNNVFITIADRPLQSTISNSPNICHAGQYIIIEHTKDHVLCTTQHKMKLIMTYLRSTLTESRLTNLAILSVDRQTV